MLVRISLLGEIGQKFCVDILASKDLIAVVSDDEAVRDSIGALLENHGFDIAEFASAAEFLRLCPKASVLILDGSMPEVDGLELAEILRAGGIETPIVLMVDLNNGAAARRIEAARHCVKLDKPVAADELVSAIQRSGVTVA